MGKRFFRYIQKVFRFSELVCQIFDTRLMPMIPTESIWLTVFIMMVTRRGSLNSIETELRVSNRLDKIVGFVKPSADTIGRVFGLMDPNSIRAQLKNINHQIKRNKILMNEWPLLERPQERER